MSNMYYGSLEKRKLYLKAWVESKEEYLSKRKIIKVLYLVALAIWIICTGFPAVALMNSSTLVIGILGGFAVGAIFAAIPFFIGQSIIRKAFDEIGAPFTRMEQDCIRIYEDGLEYIYHNSSSRYSESMDVYRIPKENMNAVRYDPKYHIVTIIGEGELLAYDDYALRRLNHQNSQRKFYDNSPYSILLTFDEENIVVELLRNMAKNKEE